MYSMGGEGGAGVPGSPCDPAAPVVPSATFAPAGPVSPIGPCGPGGPAGIAAIFASSAACVCPSVVIEASAHLFHVAEAPSAAIRFVGSKAPGPGEAGMVLAGGTVCAM